MLRNFYQMLEQIITLCWDTRQRSAGSLAVDAHQNGWSPEQSIREGYAAGYFDALSDMASHNALHCPTVVGQDAQA